MCCVSSMQAPFLTANAAEGPDYLRLPLVWMPTRRDDDQRVCEYRLPLGDATVAILQLIADKGWAMTIAHGGEQADTERGLFGTPHDALMVLVAEFVFPGDWTGPLQAATGEDASPTDTRGLF